jgi:hypothetical protein
MMARLCRDSLRGIQIINLIELNRTLAQLRLSGMATVLETRLLQAQSEAMIPIDMISHTGLRRAGVSQLLERRHKQTQFREATKHLDNFDFQLNLKMNRSLVFDLATIRHLLATREDYFRVPSKCSTVNCRRVDFRDFLPNEANTAPSELAVRQL